MVVGTWIKLKGISRHGKNRINQHGDKWEVDALGTFNGEPAVRCRSENKTFCVGFKTIKQRDARWVHLKNDKDFVIEGV